MTGVTYAALPFSCCNANVTRPDHRHTSNAKCQIRTRLPFILEMFTKLSSSVLTSPLYRTPPKTPSRQCNASGACGTVRALRTIPFGCLSTNLSGY
jgi:hypothetical protein